MLTLLNSRITLLRATSMQQKDRWKTSMQEMRKMMKAIAAGDAPAARAAAQPTTPPRPR